MRLPAGRHTDAAVRAENRRVRRVLQSVASARRPMHPLAGQLVRRQCTRCQSRTIVVEWTPVIRVAELVCLACGQEYPL